MTATPRRPTDPPSPSGAQRPTVPAMGGTRQVPAPDPIATDYLLLALRLDQHLPGIVDGYLGPASIKAQVDMEQLRSPARLRDDAGALRARVATDVVESDRRAWLDAQLVALETHAALLAGETIPFGEQVARFMGFAPPRRDDAAAHAAGATIDALLPGPEPRAERLDRWDRALEVPSERLAAVADWLVGRYRHEAGRRFALPDGEGVRVRLVHDQPWGAYCWFDGGRRSRIEINTDLPVRAPTLATMLAHETYPGHHLEHAWKEALLVDDAARLEVSVLLMNTPECPISEGLAELAAEFAIPAADTIDLLVELFDRAGLAVAADRPAARAAAERSAALAPARAVLDALRGEAAYRRFADGQTHEQVLDYLVEVGGETPVRVEKRLEFIEHPMWRTYVFVYAEGEALLRRWLDAAPAAERVTRFGRLLREPLTPASILAETPPPTPG